MEDVQRVPGFWNLLSERLEAGPEHQDEIRLTMLAFDELMSFDGYFALW
jgi:hypothetical protein